MFTAATRHLTPAEVKINNFWKDGSSHHFPKSPVAARKLTHTFVFGRNHKIRIVKEYHVDNCTVNSLINNIKESHQYQIPP